MKNRDSQKHSKSLIIFTHRLYVDGATMVVKDALEHSCIRDLYSKITIISSVDGEMGMIFRDMGCDVKCFPYQDLALIGRKDLLLSTIKNCNWNSIKYFFSKYGNKIYKSLVDLFLEHDNFWINSIDQHELLFQAAIDSNKPGIIFAHESFAPDSFIRQSVDISWGKHVYLNRMAEESKVKIAWPSSSTVEYAKKALHTKKVQLLPYFVTPADKLNTQYQNLDQIRFLVTGWFCDRKNQKVLIDVFKEIQERFTDREDYRDWTLSFIGTSFLDQNYYKFMNESIKELPPSRLSFSSLVNNSKMKRKLLDYHFVLVPAYSEALPVTTMDAMNCGTIVISTDCEGSEDMIVDGESGYIYERQNFTKLFTIIESILNKKKTDSKKLNSISNQAAKSIRKFNVKSFNINIKKLLLTPNSDYGIK